MGAEIVGSDTGSHVYKIVAQESGCHHGLPMLLFARFSPQPVGYSWVLLQEAETLGLRERRTCRVQGSPSGYPDWQDTGLSRKKLARILGRRPMDQQCVRAGKSCSHRTPPCNLPPHNQHPCPLPGHKGLPAPHTSAPHQAQSLNPTGLWGFPYSSRTQSLPPAYTQLRPLSDPGLPEGTQTPPRIHPCPSSNPDTRTPGYGAAPQRAPAPARPGPAQPS